MTYWNRFAISLSFLLVIGCATGSDGTNGGGGQRDGGGRDATGAPMDGRAAPEAGAPDAARPDTGVGSGGTCESCRSQSDCLATQRCAPLPAGGRACLPVCELDSPVCPDGFRCAAGFAAEVPDPVCAPLGDRCCVDGDGDVYGQGIGCLGPDCDDTDPNVNPNATEICNGIDDDCADGADDGASASLCPPGSQVATTACLGGACTIQSCNRGYSDCNGSVPDGCETALNTTANCGGCGMACMRAHATATCATGSCRIGSCSSGWGDCDSRDPNGCEASLTTVADCGSCGRACTYDHASAVCTSGACALLLCDSGYSDCDMSDANGCERDHSAVAGSCAAAPNLGSRDGDRNCGWPGCSSNPFDSTAFATRTGTTSAWFRARVVEDSACSASIEHRIDLEVPDGVDYDLFVYKSCGGTPVSSRGITGADESVTISSSDSFGSDDDFNYFIEVRHYSGRSCSPWTLRLFGRDC